MAGGRPTKYRPKMLKTINKLIEEYLELGIIRRKNIAPKEPEPIWVTTVDLPSIEKLAIKLKLTTQTIYQWIDPESSYYKKEFSDTVIKWNDMAKNLLKEASLSGEVKEKTSIMLLGNLKVIDYNKVSQVNINNTNNTINNNNEFNVNVIEKAHERLKIKPKEEIIDIPVNVISSEKKILIPENITPKKVESLSTIEELKQKISSLSYDKTNNNI